MSFSINPCKACHEKYRYENCGLNTMNNCIAETTAAFSDLPNNSPNNSVLMANGANLNWQSCMNPMMKQLGRSKCYMPLKMPPVFVQAPHFFPRIFVEFGDANMAMQMCLERCSSLSVNRKTCMENCTTDRNAVV